MGIHPDPARAQSFKKIAFYIAVLFFSGCGNLQTRPAQVQKPAQKSDQSFIESEQTFNPSRAAEEIKSIPLESESNQLQASLAESGPPQKQLDTRLKIPVELNSYVEKWISYFTTKDRERFQIFLDRGQQYREVVGSVLEENDLPAELYYLAMIESGYQTHASSHAQAVGVWQLIAGTGTRYGLRIDQYVDERRDPIRSSEAAAKYLRDLYNVFGSWHLAMAAYNAGEIRVLRAVMKGRTRNFWELVQLGALPSETANYVPKFLAVTLIGQNPEKYGFRVNHTGPVYPNLESIEVPGSVSLKTISQKSGLPLKTLERVNPHLLTHATPPGKLAYEIWIPAGSARQVASVQSELLRSSQQERAIASVAKGPGKVGSFHVVRPGENLSSIAHQSKVSVGHLMRINDLKSKRLFVGQKLRTQAKSYQASKTIRYKVRSGDNLTIIAHRFKTSPEQIKASNQIKRGQVFKGQILKIVLNN